MKLIDTVVVCFLSLLILTQAICLISKDYKLYKESVRLENNYERDKFIYSGFKYLYKNTTSNNDFVKKISEWKKMCTSMWKFDSFEINENDNECFVEWKIDGKVMKSSEKK